MYGFCVLFLRCIIYILIISRLCEERDIIFNNSILYIFTIE